MNPLKAATAAKDLATHRKAVYQFLGFCNHPNQGFAGSVYGEELDFLQDLVRRANSIEGPLLEIGTLFGFTTQNMALAKDEDKELITVDNFRWNPLGLSSEAHRDFTMRVLNYVCQRASTKIYEGTNTDFYSSYSGHKPSMVFIDAGHEYEDVMVDIEWAKKMGIPIISGHDYSESLPGVVQAVDEAFGSDIEVIGSVWAHYTK